MRAVLVVASLGGLLLVSGCGGTAKSEYALRLEALCNQTREQIEKVGEPKTPADLVKTSPKTDQIGRNFIRKLELIVPTETEAPKAKRLYELYDTYYGALIAALPSLRRNDQNSYFMIVEGGIKARLQADKLAKQLGAPGCARQPFS